LSFAEIFAGIRPGEEEHTAVFLSLLRCYNITAEVGRMAGSLKNKWSRKGKTLTLMDTAVAAVAIEQACILIADNVRDFPMPELKLYPLPAKR
jgi:predicted nucleic acid-binding protein